MSKIKHIVLATDLSDAGVNATKEAVTLAKEKQARLSVILVVGIPGRYTFGHKSYEDIVKELSTQAQPALTEYAKQNNIPEQAEFLIEVGSPKEKIPSLVKDLAADLLVLGSHGEHGISEQIGSTISAVLQRITCDVLIIRPRK